MSKKKSVNKEEKEENKPQFAEFKITLDPPINTKKHPVYSEGKIPQRKTDISNQIGNVEPIPNASNQVNPKLNQSKSDRILHDPKFAQYSLEGVQNSNLSDLKALKIPPKTEINKRATPDSDLKRKSPEILIDPKNRNISPDFAEYSITNGEKQTDIELIRDKKPTEFINAYELKIKKRINHLTQLMNDASEKLQYETAAQIRDQITNLWGKLTDKYALGKKYRSKKIPNTPKSQQIISRTSKLTHPKSERIRTIKKDDVEQFAVQLKENSPDGPNRQNFQLNIIQDFHQFLAQQPYLNYYSDITRDILLKFIHEFPLTQSRTPMLAVKAIRLYAKLLRLEVLAKISLEIIKGRENFLDNYPFQPRPASSIPYSRKFSPRVEKDKFLHYAWLYKDQVRVECPFIPFKNRFPNYDLMTKHQLSYYLYWRREIFKKNFIKTDIGYFLLFLYEIVNNIHGIDWQTTFEVIRLFIMQNQILMTQMGLFRFLFRIQLEFLFVNNAPSEITIQFIADERKFFTPQQFETYEIHKFLLASYLQQSKINGDEIIQICLGDYSHFPYLKNKFDDFKSHVTKIMHKINDYYLKSYQQNILQYYLPLKVRKRPFSQLRYYKDPKYINVYTFEKGNIGKIRAELLNIIKNIQNRFREYHGLKGQLKAQPCDKHIQTIIDYYFIDELEATGIVPLYSKMYLRASETEFKLNPQKIDKLAKESDEIEEILTQERKEESEIDSENQIPPLLSLQDDYFTTGLPNEINTLDDFLNLGSYSSEEQENTMDPPSDEMDYIEETQDQEISNEKQINYSNLNLSVLKSYGDEWEAFFEGLEPVHIEALEILSKSGEKSENQLALLAKRYHLLPTIINDQINQRALDIIGDIIIEGEILEEYKPMFDALFP